MLFLQVFLNFLLVYSLCLHLPLVSLAFVPLLSLVSVLSRLNEVHQAQCLVAVSSLRLITASVTVDHW